MRSPSTGTVEDPLSAFFRIRRPGKSPAGAGRVEGLRMTQEFVHRPVMADEVVALLAGVPPGLFVDATVGGGGHAAAVLAAHPGLRLVGIDRDADALAAAAAHLAPFGERVVALHHARFDRLPELVAEPVSAVLVDLGVSSPQFDRAERGFSYRLEGPLDMRMDRSQRRTAADVVNGADEATLARLFAQSGASPAASPGPWSPAAPSPRRPSWPTPCATPSRRRPGARAATPPAGCSRPCASR
jgi:hypothetical protein